MSSTSIRYYGWSAFSLDTPNGSILFDPFYRPYCGAHWFDLEDFEHAKAICVTHGHEEHFLDVPIVARKTKATVVGPKSVSAFLKRRRNIPQEQLLSVNAGESVEILGARISAFNWKHRDINLWKAITKAVFAGNATQLSWAWSSATNAPFYAPYTGYHLTLPDGLTIMNYNEGFNSKMTDHEIGILGEQFKTDVLLAGMQLDFANDLARGATALQPKLIILFPPHDKFHAMMEVTSRPWSEFQQAAAAAVPDAHVVIATPGSCFDARSAAQTQFSAKRDMATSH